MNNSKILRALYISFLGLVAGSTVHCVYGSQEQKELSHVIDIGDQDELSYPIAIELDGVDLAKKDCLPSECSVSPFEQMSEEQATLFLKYLSTFNGGLAKSRSPFTKEEQQIFNDVMDVEKRTQWWLSRGQAAILASAMSPMIGFAALSDSVSGQTAIVGISVATTFAGLINAWLAFYATGTLPDEASRKANDRQNTFNELKKVHTKLARVWIDMHFSEEKHKREAALEIARNMRNSFDNLRDRVKEKVGYDHADTMLCPTKAAMDYILDNKKLKISTSIHDYIVNKENQHSHKLLFENKK